MAITLKFSDMTSSSIFFWHCFVSLVKFSYWFKFHVSIVTGSGVVIISSFKELTKILEIGNAPIWVLPNIWTLGRISNTKFGTFVSNKMLLNAAKCHGYTPVLGRREFLYLCLPTRFFYKQDFYRQCQAEIGNKSSKS